MELSEALRRRRMTRRFDPDRPVPAGTLDRLLDAGVRAPSAGFTQAVGFVVLAEPEERAAFWAATSEEAADNVWLRGLRTAPLLVLVWTSQEAYLDRYAQPDKGWTDRDPGRWSAPYWFVDAGMASMAVLLTAVDTDLGACFFGIPPERIAAVRSSFDIPAEQLSVGVIALGYPVPGGPGGSPERRPRRDRNALIHRGRWHSDQD